MAISIREEEIQRLVRFYRTAIEDIAKIVATVDFERPRMFQQVQAALLILEELDERTARWARRNIAALYRSASEEAQRDIRLLGLAIRDPSRTATYGLINDQAIRVLLLDPQVGFLSNMGEVTQQIRNRWRSIQSMAKRLIQHQRFFDEGIARIGFLEGRGVSEIRDRIVDEMSSLKNVSDLEFTPRARRLPPTEIIRQVADLPVVKVPAPNTAAGVRNIRADVYAEMLARTKTSQAANLARRNRALQHGQSLMQVSKNLPLQNDACSLYLGKAFALTEEAKVEWGIPLVSELPNGGAPFHPNCTHQEILFVPEFRHEVEVELAIVPPPAWALNRPWGAIQKEYRKRGGFANFAKFNAAGAAMARGTGGRVRRGNVEGDEFTAIEPNEPQTPRKRRRRR